MNHVRYPHLMLVLSNARPGADDAFNTWYSEVHIPEVLNNLDGLSWAQRFALSELQLSDAGPSHHYLALYGIEAGRLAEARDSVAGQRAERAEAIAAGRAPKISVSDDLQPDIQVLFFDAITERLAATGGGSVTATAEN